MWQKAPPKHEWSGTLESDQLAPLVDAERLSHDGGDFAEVLRRLWRYQNKFSWSIITLPFAGYADPAAGR